MKTNRGFASCIALASLALVLLAGSARADTFTATFTNEFGNGLWARDARIGVPPDPGELGNWSTGAFPANGHSILNPNTGLQVPGPNPSYDVVINIATPCTLGGVNVAVESVAVGSNSTLNIASNVLTVRPGGTVNNQGLINLAGDLDFPNGSVTLTGGGTINFNLGRFIQGATVTNVNNLIQGKTDAASGGLGNGQTTIINQANGVIEANLSGQPFLVYPGGVGGLTNAGLMQASNGGILKVLAGSSVPVTNTGGTIQALTGSEVQLFTSSPGITGGILTTSGTGVIRVAASTTVYLTDLTNSGTFIANDNTTTHLTGTINNTGIISLNPTVNSADILPHGTVTLTGGGTVNMTIGSRFVLGALTNVNNLIQGETTGDSGGFGNGQTTIVNQAAGVIDANISGKPFLVYPGGVGGLTNAGLMQASNGGILKVVAGCGVPVTNTGGTIQALNGSEVHLFTSCASGITGGTLTTSGTGVIRVPVGTLFLTDLTTSGSLITNNNASTSLSGTITNTGIMTFEANSRLQFHANTTISGAGGVLLQDNALMYISSRAVTNGAGHTIKGNGTILIDGGGSFTNNGNVAPGLSPGKLTVSGNYTQGSTGALNMEVGGGTPVTGYDQLAVTGNAALNGTLNVSLINGFVPAVGDVFQFITTGSFSGAFSTINTTGFTAQVNYSASSITMTVLTVGGVTPTPTPTPSKLLNIATRMRVQTGENVIIGGFIIAGTDSKNVIIRGIGPSLSSFFSDALANPTLELFQGSTLLMSNNDWKDTQRTQIEATGLQPSQDFESAIVQTLAPGSYTAVLRGLGNTTGIGVVEAYDLNQGANSKLANIATRGFVEAGDNVMIGGLIIGPASGSNARLVVRAIGPSLTAFGIAGALQDPTVELKDSNGSTLNSNDNWQQGQPTELQQLGLAPTNVAESALVATLAPGAYTAIVRGVGNTTGVGLVEVYHVQ